MAAHQYWRVMDMQSAAGAFTQLCEFYLRQTYGGSNEVPTSSAQANSYSGGTSVAESYDGNPATFYMQYFGDNNPHLWVAYGYAAPIDPVEVTLLSSTGDIYQRTMTTFLLQYSDVGLGGPWTDFKSTAFPAPWTGDGQTQLIDLYALSAGIAANEVANFVVARFRTPEIDATLLTNFGVINFPTEFIQGNMVRSFAVYRVINEMEVNQATTFVVCRGVLARPAITPWTFTLDGHNYLVINTYNETMVYDFHAKHWYVWGNGESPMWAPQVGQNWNAQIGFIISNLGGQKVSNVLCGDGTTSALYFLDPELDEDYSSLGEPAKKFARIITGQLISRSNNYTSLPGVEVTASDGRTVVASDMDVTLSYSDDTGITYQSFGSRTVILGDYSPLLQWQSLGSYRQPGRLLRLTDHGAVRRVDDWSTNDG